MPDSTGEKRLKIVGLSFITVIIVMLLSVIIFSSAIIFFYNLNGQSMDFSDAEILMVPTGSMDGEPQPYEIPTIPKDSMVMVHELSYEQARDLKVGDVITFHQDGVLKVHRIVEINVDDETIKTKGDANQLPDSPISFSDVSGKVVGVSAIIGHIVFEVRNVVNSSPILVIAGIIMLIIIIVSIMEIITIVRKNGDED